MASIKVLSRLSSRLHSLTPKLATKQSVLSHDISSLKSTVHSQLLSASARRFSLITRLPVELASLGSSMMPLHSAVASARLVSSLSIESQCWGLVPQGISMPL